MTERSELLLAADWILSGLRFIELFDVLLFGQFLGAIETLAALAATIRAIGKEEQDPKFQKASALGAMHMIAATQRTIPFLGVDEQAKSALHWPRIIAPGEIVRNRAVRIRYRSNILANQKDARTCSAWCRSLPRFRFTVCVRGRNRRTGGRRTARRSSPIFRRWSWGA